MRIFIEKSRIRGAIAAPPSKSYTIRGLMCAALAEGESRLISPLSSDDTEAALEVLGQIGVGLKRGTDCWQVSGGHLKPPAEDLFCRDSAATMRFMTAICSLIPGSCRLVAGESLSRRPIEPLLQALRQLGVKCHAEVKSVVVDGGLRGGTTEIPGDISSQFISALLLVAPLAEEGVTIRLTTPPESKPYLEMTLNCLAQFGITVKTAADLTEFVVPRQQYRPANYTIEGDWSSASYFLALGALSDGVTITNLKQKSLQGDKIMLNLLRDMGAHISSSGDAVSLSGTGLKAITADLSDCIDLLPTVATLAALAEGTSHLSGIERARAKESNRVTAVKEGLEKMGIRVTEERSRLTIFGGQPKGALIDSRNDHRIAMAFSILGAAVGSTVIEGAECVAKTYPQFWAALKQIGGEVKSNGQ